MSAESAWSENQSEIRELRAEIKRLKSDHQIVRNFLDNADSKLREHEKLITELADWVKIYSDQRSVENPALLKLLQRAREATK
jgi:septal ring factor EnvC (AmiA/AmiB activator)